MLVTRAKALVAGQLRWRPRPQLICVPTARRSLRRWASKSAGAKAPPNSKHLSVFVRVEQQLVRWFLEPATRVQIPPRMRMHRRCPRRTVASSLVFQPRYAGASPAADAAVISGETTIGRVNHASGPFVRRERMMGSIPSAATTSIRSKCTRHRSMDGTQACEACWLRFNSSRWYQAGR